MELLEDMARRRATARRIDRSESAGSESAATLMGRVRGEYREMPGLCLTIPQACRLWQIDRADCERVLGALTAEGFLARTAGGAFIARH
jgi:hypothetical protein